MGVVINRDFPTGCFPFKDVFGGFEEVDAVRSIFGIKIDKVLTNLEVEIEDGQGYMRINYKKGSIIVNAKYLRKAKNPTSTSMSFTNLSISGSTWQGRNYGTSGTPTLTGQPSWRRTGLRCEKPGRLG